MVKAEGADVAGAEAVGFGAGEVLVFVRVQGGFREEEEGVVAGVGGRRGAGEEEDPLGKAGAVDGPLFSGGSVEACGVPAGGGFVGEEIGSVGGLGIGEAGEFALFQNGPGELALLGGIAGDPGEDGPEHGAVADGDGQVAAGQGAAQGDKGLSGIEPAAERGRDVGVVEKEFVQAGDGGFGKGFLLVPLDGVAKGEEVRGGGWVTQELFEAEGGVVLSWC